MLDHHVRQSVEVGGEMRRFSLPHPLPYTSSPPIIPLYFLSLSSTLLVELYQYLSPAFHCLKIIFKKGHPTQFIVKCHLVTSRTLIKYRTKKSRWAEQLVII